MCQQLRWPLGIDGINAMTYYVGMPLETMEEIEGLPVGATFGPERYAWQIYRRTVEGYVRLSYDGISRIIARYWDYTVFSLNGYNRIISLPSETSSDDFGELLDLTTELIEFEATPARGYTDLGPIPFQVVPEGTWSGYSGDGFQSLIGQAYPDPYYPDCPVGSSRAIFIAFRCGDCHEEYPISLPAHVESGLAQREIDRARNAAIACHEFCQVCRFYGCGQEHFYCDHCQTYDCGLDDDEHEWCDTCDRWNCGRTHAIHDYSFKPRPAWLGGSPSEVPYFLGFELEVTSYSPDDDAHRITQWADANIGQGALYCKHDGSVEGFEIVSHPMTPQFFETIDWRGFFAEVRKNDNNGSTYEPTGHGLHVHVSRTAFDNPLTLARWVYMWNCQNNRSRAIELCRRHSSQWANFTEGDVKQIHRVAKAEKSWTRHAFYPSFQRYSLINLTNPDTVEFRGFRSTRRADHFRRSIRSIYQTVDYVRNMQPWHATPNEYALELATAGLGS